MSPGSTRPTVQRREHLDGKVCNRGYLRNRAGTDRRFLTAALGAIRQQISDLAAKFRLPTMYGYRDYAEAGGLISYGPDRREMYRKAAEYADKILKGAKPADLPVERPTKFALVLNTKTAKSLRLTIPQSLLLQADQVIK
jgi:putative ABC transport system substrate-binding protein